MNEFESDWISLSQSFVQNGWIQDGRVQDGCHHQVESEWMSEVFFVQNGWMQDGRIQDGCHHQVEWEWMSLSQIELVWVRVLCKMAESKMAEFKMAAIIKLIRLNEWNILCKWWRGKSEWSFLFFFWKWWEPILASVGEFERKNKDGWFQDGQIQDGSHQQVESEWMSEVFFVQMVGINVGKCEWVWEEKLRWLNPIWWISSWQNSRWLPSWSWERMNEFESDWISLSQSFVQNGWIQDGRVQDDYHHQIQREWMSLSQIELVWVRVLCKMVECKMAEFKMATIIKLSHIEWVKFFLCKMVECKMAEFKMAAMIRLSENEWVWVRLN